MAEDTTQDQNPPAEDPPPTPDTPPDSAKEEPVDPEVEDREQRKPFEIVVEPKRAS